MRRFKTALLIDNESLKLMGIVAFGYSEEKENHVFKKPLESFLLRPAEDNNGKNRFDRK